MQTDLFAKTPKPPKSITLELRGKIPSYKNNKMLIRPSLKGVLRALGSGNLEMVRQMLTALWKKPVLMITKPEYQVAMNGMIASIESQLLSAFRTDCGQTLAGSSIRSWIASCVPEDDCWTKLPEITIKAELCEKGNEGATITIERL